MHFPHHGIHPLIPLKVTAGEPSGSVLALWNELPAWSSSGLNSAAEDCRLPANDGQVCRKAERSGRWSISPRCSGWFSAPLRRTPWRTWQEPWQGYSCHNPCPKSAALRIWEAFRKMILTLQTSSQLQVYDRGILQWYQLCRFSWWYSRWILNPLPKQYTLM